MKKEAFNEISYRKRNGPIQDSSVMSRIDSSGKNDEEIWKLFHTYTHSDESQFAYQDTKKNDLILYKGINGDKELLVEYSDIHRYLSEQNFFFQKGAFIRSEFDKDITLTFLDLKLKKDKIFEASFIGDSGSESKEVLATTVPFVKGMSLEEFGREYGSIKYGVATRLRSLVEKCIMSAFVPLLQTSNKKNQQILRIAISQSLVNTKISITEDQIYLTCTDIGSNIRTTVETIRDLIGLEKIRSLIKK